MTNDQPAPAERWLLGRGEEWDYLFGPNGETVWIDGDEFLLFVRDHLNALEAEAQRLRENKAYLEDKVGQWMTEANRLREQVGKLERKNELLIQTIEALQPKEASDA